MPQQQTPRPLSLDDWNQAKPLSQLDWDAAKPITAPPTQPAAAPRTWLDTARDILGFAKDVNVGAIKSGVSTVLGVTELGNKLLAPTGLVDRVDPAVFQAARSDMATPVGTGEQIGYTGANIAQFVGPGGAAKGLVNLGVRGAARLGMTTVPRVVQGAARLGTEAALAGGLAQAQTGDESAAPVAAAMTVGTAGATRAAVALGRFAEPLVRSAIKPTVTAMKRVAGAGATGIDAKAKALVTWIVENRVTTADKARAIFSQAESELQAVLRGRNAPTDAPQRAIRYLKALENSAAKQGLAADDVATIRNAAAELLQGRMGQSVVTPTGTVRRVPRINVTPSEALESARASSMWGTRKAWGEMKGASMSAKKAVERAQRDALKAAVPEATPLLATESKAIQAREVLDRMAFREANRQPMSLEAAVLAAPQLAQGKVPIFGFAVNLIRNNQLKSGIWLDRLTKAIDRSDKKGVVAALKVLGVSIPVQYMRD